MAEEDKQATLERMSCYEGDGANFTSPRMLNRQMKSYFLELQCLLLGAVLHKLQQIFASREGYNSWLAACIATIGLCMALEDQQKMNSATAGSDERRRAA